jgi:AhpD family alkylhydroperoxidase
VTIDYRNVFPQAVRAMGGLEAAVHDSSLEPRLLELVKMRASQINGCAYCLDMHSKDARASGEHEQRLYLLSAWREAPLYSDRERAALAWCEALTLIASSGAPHAAFDELALQFDEEEIVALTLAIVAINGWNRFAIGLHSPVGHYTSPRSPTHASDSEPRANVDPDRDS